ncbi:MAG TPA: helix-turn-helix transcriptional regulator [Terriglobia bacterium]|nr:helix-turn-helix transcriptional regulator [Terriglobia bacterium]
MGRKVRFLRQGKGWALSDLAAASGVSKAYISDLENGAAGKPNIQYIFAIAAALDITLDELLEDATVGTGEQSKRRKALPDLPPGLPELQQELDLSDDEVEMLAKVNFRGNRPKDKGGWRFLWEAIKMLGERNTQR